MRILGFIAVLATLLAPFAAYAEDAYTRVMESKTLRCGYVLYPPYMDKDLQTGAFVGHGYEVVEALGDLMGWEIDWVEEIPVGNEVAALEAGRVDSVCAITGTFDPNMFARIDFSDRFMFVRNTIYARADDPRFQGEGVTFEDLNKPDITFVGIEGDATLIYASMLFPEASLKELPQLSDTAQVFLEMSSGKADVVVVEPPVAGRALKTNKDAFRRVDFDGKLPKYGAALAFAKGSDRLRTTVNTALSYMNVNGMIDEIIDRHDPNGDTILRITKPYKD